MTFWVVRAGKHGENENYALEHQVVSIGWDDVGDLSRVKDRDELQALVSETWPDESLGTTRVWTGELWAFRETIKVGDFVGLPLKSRAAIAIGRVEGSYKFDQTGPHDGKHQRSVKWLRTDVPRVEVDQDLLYSLGSTLTVFRVKRNNAEERLAALAKGRKPIEAPQDKAESEAPDEAGAGIDLEQFSADQINEFIGRKYRGHELARLVGAVLVAEGYQILLSPPGADGGVDIIAGAGPMGFDSPRLAVQVKSSDAPADVTVVRELQGVMPRFGADRGLVVCWGGFKESVLKEARQLFFAIRLWDAGDLVMALQKNYSKLSPEVQAELPLKQLWALVQE